MSRSASWSYTKMLHRCSPALHILEASSPRGKAVQSAKKRNREWGVAKLIFAGFEKSSDLPPVKNANFNVLMKDKAEKLSNLRLVAKLGNVIQIAFCEIEVGFPFTCRHVEPQDGE